jgi:hypothetical protein
MQHNMNVFFRPNDDLRNRPGLFEFLADVNGKPFAAMLSKGLLRKFPDPEFGWLWTLQLACGDVDPEYEMPTEAELNLLNALSIELFEALHTKLDILFVGTTVHRNNFEMMFLGKAEDVAAIGGAVYDLPEQMPEIQDRFLQFKSDHDPEWKALLGVYQVVREYSHAD